MTKIVFFYKSIYATRFALALILLSALTSCDRIDIWSKTLLKNSVGTVTFTPSPGTYSSDQTVALTCATSGATIYYTTDGTVPDETSAVYSMPISVSGDGTSMTISAFAAATDLNDSAVVSGMFTIDYAQVSTPQILPPGGTYTSDQTVTITCGTSGAVIHYTTDGTTPTGSSAVYSSPISVAGDGTTMTVTAIAIASGMTDSTVASESYTIDYDQVATPDILPTGGVYSSDQSVTITCSTSGAVIHYTTDGSTPDGSSAVYSTPISVSGDGTSMTISAIAIASGMSDSAVAAASYTIDYDQASTPSILPAGGTYASDQSVTITCATSGATIYYTTDGSTPNTSSSIYSSAISVSGNGTTMIVSAYAVASGYDDSVVASESYVIDYPDVATPVISPASGTYTSDQNVTITCTTSGATIYYTTDGTTPTTSSSIYSSAIPVSGDGTTMTINAYAVATGYVDSVVASESYTIDYPYVVAPVISLPGGLYNSDQSVTITCATPGATIYYTIDGTTPNTLSTEYTAAIPVAGNGTDLTIKAYAVLSGNTDSAVASSTIQIRYVVYYTLDDNICISYDDGSTWTQENFSSNTITCVFAYGNEIYVGGNSYLNYFDGTSWNVRSIFANVVGLYVDSDYLYASTAANGLYYSDDNGATMGGPTLSITTQRAVYVDSGIVYLASNGGLWYSYDSTSNKFYFNYQPTAPSSQSPITTSHGLDTNDVYDVYVIGNNRYLATANGVSVYTDAGDDPGACVNHTTSTGGTTYGVCSDGTLIYAATSNGLSRYDGVSAWDTMISSVKCNRVRVSGSIVYAATDGGLYISYDKGVNWNTYSSGNSVLDVHVSPQ